jgi:hypothetical protein
MTRCPVENYLGGGKGYLTAIERIVDKGRIVEYYVGLKKTCIGNYRTPVIVENLYGKSIKTFGQQTGPDILIFIYTHEIEIVNIEIARQIVSIKHYRYSSLKKDRGRKVGGTGNQLSLVAFDGKTELNRILAYLYIFKPEVEM